MTDSQKNVLELIKRATETKSSDDAMRFAQAACNAANALATLDNIKRNN